MGEVLIEVLGWVLIAWAVVWFLWMALRGDQARERMRRRRAGTLEDGPVNLRDGR